MATLTPSFASGIEVQKPPQILLDRADGVGDTDRVFRIAEDRSVYSDKMAF